MCSHREIRPRLHANSSRPKALAPTRTSSTAADRDQSGRRPREGASADVPSRSPRSAPQCKITGKPLGFSCSKTLTPWLACGEGRPPRRARPRTRSPQHPLPTWDSPQEQDLSASARASSSTSARVCRYRKVEASAPRHRHRAIGTIVDGTLVTTARRGAACRRLFERCCGCRRKARSRPQYLNGHWGIWSVIG